MKQPTCYVGLDVHKDTIAMAVAGEGRNDAPRELGVIAHDVPRLLKKLGRLGDAELVSVAYEAGPTGYGLCRRLRDAGYRCEVIAPSKTPKTGDRVKTDRRDALKLARYLRSGDLCAVRVPDGRDEAVRDLCRSRWDAKRAELVARHQLSKFLLRHDKRWSGKTNWGKAHLEWIRKLDFEHDAQCRVATECLFEVERLEERVARLQQSIEELSPTLSQAPLAVALQAFRGIKILTATSLVAEIGDFRRFQKPSKLMGYLGVVPSEFSSGSHTQRGRITKTGNGHVRRLLIEAAWAYRLKPRVSRLLRYRSTTVAPGVKAIAWKAQNRLHGKYWRLVSKGMSSQKALVAVARELVGFLWDAAQQEQLVLE